MSKKKYFQRVEARSKNMKDKMPLAENPKVVAQSRPGRA